MKKCLKCNAKYDDNKMFCPKCGSKLVTEIPAVQTQMQTPSTPSSSFWDSWGATVLAAVGFLVFWEVAGGATFGVALACLGGIWGHQSDNNINKVASIAIAAIALFLYVIIWLL